MMDLWEKCKLSREELEGVYQEGYRSYSAGEGESNLYPNNTLEHEFFSDGWEDAHDDAQGI